MDNGNKDFDFQTALNELKSRYTIESVDIFSRFYLKEERYNNQRSFDAFVRNSQYLRILPYNTKEFIDYSNLFTALKQEGIIFTGNEEDICTLILDLLINNFQNEDIKELNHQIVSFMKKKNKMSGKDYYNYLIKSKKGKSLNTSIEEIIKNVEMLSDPFG